MEWQPIETAPKALHKPILLAVVFSEENGGGAEVGEGYWDDGFEGSSDQPPCEPGWCIPSLGFFNKLTPTHWMPLPEPPHSHTEKETG